MSEFHKKQWEFLEKKFESGALAHAYLFTGQEEIGKKIFAKEFAEFIGCKFPDLMVVSEANEKDYKFGDGGEITVAQVRKIQEFLSYKAYNGGYKVVIVDNAEAMNQEAQNCFLKTLEEPKDKTLLIMISSKPDMLLATITSRCQEIKFLKHKNIPENPEKIKREQEILKELLPALKGDLAERFKYVKSLDLEVKNPREILEVIQNYFREKLLANTSDKRTLSFLKLSEDISQKLLFTNANPKLALEILLMEL